MLKRKVFFRADGNAKIGLGHVFRSLALAEMLKEDFDCYFIIRNPLEILRTQILDICQGIIELPTTNDDILEARRIVANYFRIDDIVVLDGYHFVTEYQKIIKNKGCKIVCIDDIHSYHFIADAVINHAGGLLPKDYSAEPYTQFYLGLQYALLRRPFREATLERESKTPNNNIFICLGGADPKNDTIKVLEYCAKVGTFDRCFLVLGGAYLHQETLEEYLLTTTLDTTLLSNLSAEEMVKYMKKCSFAITPPSTISYEYSSVGGILFLKTIANNQVDIHRFFTQNQLAFNIKKISKINEFVRNETLVLQTKIFDGLQQKRLRNVFRTLTFDIRKANIDDLNMYFDWINEPATRLQSYNSDAIALKDHQKWFEKKVYDSKSVMYIVLKNKDAIGQIRFDLSEVATISYSVDKKHRGLGFGKIVLRKGIAQYRAEFGNRLAIVGFVKKSNIASIKAFKSIYFTEEEATEHKNSCKYILL
jgi:UDP-2,4-diacetamido-2,4,6-trideoxy-beta-L-altropyranose hydrolase